MSTKISTAFYDSLFGKDQADSSMNQLENETLDIVRERLNDRTKLSESIPPLPNILLELIDSIKKPDATFLEFVEIIEKDPSLAITVLKVANSAKYSKGDEEVISIKTAVGLLGVTGIANISTSILMQSIIPQKPIYFKKFGKQIWEHSLHCATVAQKIAVHYKQDEFDAHFIGLIHDVGKIIIFESLCEAFSKVLSDDTPGSSSFKQLMSEMSLDISYSIAKEWNLPDIYCETLLQQRTSIVTPLAKILFKANIISESYFLYKKGALSDEQIAQLLFKIKIDNVIWQNFLASNEELEPVN